MSKYDDILARGYEVRAGGELVPLYICGNRGITAGFRVAEAFEGGGVLLWAVVAVSNEALPAERVLALGDVGLTQSALVSGAHFGLPCTGLLPGEQARVFLRFTVIGRFERGTVVDFAYDDLLPSTVGEG